MRTPSEHYCFIFSNIYQNTDKVGSGFPPTSGQIAPTSGSSDWPNWDPHMAYSVVHVPPRLRVLHGRPWGRFTRRGGRRGVMGARLVQRSELVGVPTGSSTGTRDIETWKIL